MKLQLSPDMERLIFGIVLRPIPIGVRWFFYGLAWACVVVDIRVENPEHLQWLPFFPLGLIALLPNGAEYAFVAFIAWFAFAPMGWALYLILSMLLIRTRRLTIFLVFYVLFCLLLAWNVSGLNKAAEAIAGVH